MQIPQSFRLGRKKYKVERHANSAKLYGTFLPEAKRIIVFNAIRGRQREAAALSETFWHEVTHAILRDMDSPKWKDEAFVDAFSKRLNQVCLTAGV